MSVKTFAAIDVGSFELTMKIFDFSGKNTMRVYPSENRSGIRYLCQWEDQQ